MTRTISSNDFGFLFILYHLAGFVFNILNCRDGTVCVQFVEKEKAKLKNEVVTNVEFYKIIYDNVEEY